MMPLGAASHEQEGVTKFALHHRRERLDPGRYGALAAELAGWRRVMFHLGVLGQDAARYGGAGFGNLSARVGAPSSPLGRRAMLVSCTQTGGLLDAGLDALCVVERYDIERNRVDSVGPCEPSSEAMTHGAIYDLGPHIRAVLHGHAPELWRGAAELGLPRTRPEVAYGTPEMAREMRRLWSASGLAEQQILVMTGHEDGVVAFGRTLDEAGAVLVRALAASFRR